MSPRRGENVGEKLEAIAGAIQQKRILSVDLAKFVGCGARPTVAVTCSSRFRISSRFVTPAEPELYRAEFWAGYWRKDGKDEGARASHGADNGGYRSRRLRL